MFLAKFVFFSFFSLSIFAREIVQTIWGEEEMNDPLLEELLNSKALQRLKMIDVSGPNPYFGLMPYFSRFDHSVGVWVLLKKVGLSLKEQAAGLLHNESHLPFSHLADNLFEMENQEHSYQDTIHLWHLSQTDAVKIAERYDVKLKELNPDLPEYKGLEQGLPDMCADRIQYNIHTGVIMKKITKDDAARLIKNLKFDEEKWYFQNKEDALIFGRLPLHFTKTIWGDPLNAALYHYFAKALKRAITIGLLKKEGLFFGKDQDVMNILNASKDDEIMKNLLAIGRLNESFSLVDKDFDKYVRPKFRGIDPLIKVKGKLTRLSNLDDDFKKSFEEVKEWCKKGYGLKFKF